MAEKGKMMSKLSPKDVQEVIERKAMGSQAAALAGQLIDEFGRDVLAHGGATLPSALRWLWRE